jgi:hypothetical protein
MVSYAGMGSRTAPTQVAPGGPVEGRRQLIGVAFYDGGLRAARRAERKTDAVNESFRDDAQSEQAPL